MGEYVPLRTLESSIVGGTICVRVSRLWCHRGGADKGPVKDIHFVVIDRQGDALHAFVPHGFYPRFTDVVPHGFYPRFTDVVHETNVYEISKFRVVKKQEVMRPVDAPFAIMITSSTVFKLKESLTSVLPEWSYSLTPFLNLPAPTVEPGCLFDVIGSISAISDIEEFDLPRAGGVLIKRHVHLKDLNGHEIKIVLWGDCALRFNGTVIRALGQTELAVAIFVGTTIQEYDGERGLAGMAACSWYINEDIVDINVFSASLEGSFQPIVHAPLPHVLPRRSQVGDDWPKKQVAQMSAFNFFENKEFKFRCTVTLSRVRSRKRWWYTSCQRCHRLARPTTADAHTYACSDSLCPSTTATVGYFLSVIGYDQTGEAEFTFFGGLAEELTGNSIHRVIRANQPAGTTVVNDAIAASRVRFPPPQVSKILGDRYRFVVAVTEASFAKAQTSFWVRKIEAVFPKARRRSSVDTVIPATSWDIDTPVLEPADEPGPSSRVNGISTNRVPAASVNDCATEVLTSEFLAAAQRAVDYHQIATNRPPEISEETSAGGAIKILLGNSYKLVPTPAVTTLSSDVTALNRKKRKLILDARKEVEGDVPRQ